jgi:sigma-B regulation protein RsbU (phosphoserine phosphatase)
MTEIALENVEGALELRRAAIRQLLEEASAEKLDTVLAQLGDGQVREHLATIDSSLQLARRGDLGRCTVCHDPVESQQLLVDYTAHVCLTHLTEEQASSLEREIALAQRTQQSLLPATIPEVPGLEIAAFSRPAEFVSGDYFDFIPLAGGNPALLVADVAGHGVSASLHMARLQALARALIPESPSPSAAIARLHRLFIHNSHFPTFVTFFLGIFSPATRELTYCNAGHNPPLLLRAGGAAETAAWLRPTSAAIGLIEEGTFHDRRLALQAGDLLVAYTDGVVESASSDGELFGVDRLLAAVRQRWGAAPSVVIAGVTSALETFLGRRAPSDDITLVAARAG